MRRTLHILFFVVVAIGTLVNPARALPLEPEPVDRSVARAPVTAEMVVVLDGLAQARTMPAVSGIMGVLNDLGLTEDLAPHWATLSALLGWDERETLDRLLGTRVVLVVESLDQTRGKAKDAQKDNDTPWAILSDISAATDQRLKEKIPLAARKAVDGVPVFALERGDYELATIRVPGGVGGGGAPEERVMLLLGPAKRPALFDTMVRGAGKGIPGNLGGTPVVRELEGHTSPGVLVAVRLDPEEGAAARPAWDDFLVCTATPKGRAWECRITIRDADARKHVRRIEPSSDAPYREMSKHTMLAVMETRLAAPGAKPTNFFEQFLALFTIPQGAGNLLTGRQAIAVWPRGGKSRDDTPTALCCAVAMETSDVQGMAPLGDKHLGQLVEQIERAMGGPGFAVPNLAGVSCQAVRSIPLELPERAKQVFDGHPHVAWSYPVAPKAESVKETDARAGWWQVCVGGAGEGEVNACEKGGGACADSSRQMVDALLQPPAGGEVNRWISLGSVRPTRWVGIAKVIVDGLGNAIPQPEGIVRMLGRIDRVEWRLAARDNDDVAGTVRLEMAPLRSTAK
jgi:hypothetical protein